MLKIEQDHEFTSMVAKEREQQHELEAVLAAKERQHKTELDFCLQPSICNTVPPDGVLLRSQPPPGSQEVDCAGSATNGSRYDSKLAYSNDADE